MNLVRSRVGKESRAGIVRFTVAGRDGSLSNVILISAAAQLNRTASTAKKPKFCIFIILKPFS